MTTRKQTVQMLTSFQAPQTAKKSHAYANFRWAPQRRLKQPAGTARPPAAARGAPGFRACSPSSCPTAQGRPTRHPGPAEASRRPQARHPETLILARHSLPHGGPRAGPGPAEPR